MAGYNGTILAYGQTGTGKTFTMEGDQNDKWNPVKMGMIPRSFKHIFEHINSTPDTQFLVYASFIELYKEQLRDLLSPNFSN